MDEILIEEKKYVSSKQAAKITGYAKDYIGQLCREGRVPARLVGRSWYVLEAAIQDHRFGSHAVEPAAKVEERATPSLQSTWESPRYESSPAEVLTFINRPQEREPAVTAPAADHQGYAEDDPPRHLQDAWQEFFNHPEEARRQEAPAIVPEPENQSIEEEEVNIPIHAIHHSPPEESRPLRIVEEYPRAQVVQSQPPVRQERQMRIRGGGAARAVRIIGVLLAAISVVTALLGSGYFDENAISHSPASIIAGISIYNK